MNSPSSGAQKPRPSQSITRFLARELLYDFASQNLGPDRQTAVGEQVEKDEDLQEEFASMKYGLEYCQELSKTQISEQVVAEILETRYFWQKIGASFYWRRWPPLLRWTSEALSIALLVALTVSLVPWGRIKNTLSSNRAGLDLVELHLVQGGSKQETLVFDPEFESLVAGYKEEIKISPVKKVKLREPNNTEKLGPDQLLSTPISNSNSQSLLMDPPQEPLNVRSSVAVTSTSIDDTSAVEPKVQSMPHSSEGFIYRLYMVQGHLDELTPEIVKKIIELGGSKAKEVELGRRKSEGSYFHAVLPERNYELLVEYLKSIGPVQINRESNRRVMPPGQLRLILWIQQLNEKPSSKVEGDS